MEKEYIKAVERKLKKQGFSEEEIVEKIKNIINPKIMEPEEIKIEEEVVEETPVVEEEVDTDEEVV